MLLRFINRFREGVRTQERQSPAESLLNGHLTTVIVGVPSVVSIFDGTQTRVGNNTSSDPIGIEGLLVQVAQGGKVCAFGSNVVDSRHYVPGEQALNADIPLIYSRINRFRIDCAQANRYGIDGARIKREVEARLQTNIVGRRIIIRGADHIVD